VIVSERISKTQAFLSLLIRVNPVVGMKNGEIYPYAREISRAEVIDHL